MQPIFLHLASRDVLKRRFAKERREMNPDDVGLRFYISGVALAEGDDLELIGEGSRGILESWAGRRAGSPDSRRPLDRRFGFDILWLGGTASQADATASALAIFDAPLHVPVAGKILGRGEAGFLGRLPVIAAAKVGRALPETAALTPVNVERPIHQNMAFSGHFENSKMCKTCVSLFRSLDLS
ncbi:MAG: hypothetical protein WC816_03770 [Sphingomonas sp.]